MNDEHKDEHLTLKLLTAIEQQSDVTQRSLARRLGVALGLTNSYLKRCIGKGLIKIREAPANRYFYYLTPHGFSEKSRLTAKYLTISFNFYRQAGESCRRVFEQCKTTGITSVVLCGLSELAEIAYVRAHEHDLQIVGMLDPHSERAQFFKLDVSRKMEALPNYDALIITDVNDPVGCYTLLKSQAGFKPILIPDLLGINIAGLIDRSDTITRQHAVELTP